MAVNLRGWVCAFIDLPGRARLAASTSVSCLFRSIQVLCFVSAFDCGIPVPSAPQRALSPALHALPHSPPSPSTLQCVLRRPKCLSTPHAHDSMIALSNELLNLGKLTSLEMFLMFKLNETLPKKKKKLMPVGMGEGAWSSKNRVQEAQRLGLYCQFLPLTNRLWDLGPDLVSFFHKMKQPDLILFKDHSI